MGINAHFKNFPTGSFGSIYMDYAATTPLDPQILPEMIKYLGSKDGFGNSDNPTHIFGRSARRAIEQAQWQMARLLAADPSEIIWTSGATESINLAIKGAALASNGLKHHVVTSSIEHKAVLDSCKQVARRGFEVTYLTPRRDGIILPEDVANALREDTLLVSLMHVNNETGTKTDVARISDITRSKGVLLHVDAAQSAARLSLDTTEIQADLVSLSAHKMYGPKGAGALFVRRDKRGSLFPILHGADGRLTLRPGTQATHQIVGMGEAAAILQSRMDEEVKRITELDEQLKAGLLGISGSRLNGSDSQRAPGILNICFESVNATSLMMVLRDLSVSSGSACTSSGVDISHVLSGMGLSRDRASSSIRFSLGRFSTPKEVSYAISRLQEVIPLLRRMHRRWSFGAREPLPSRKASVVGGA